MKYPLTSLVVLSLLSMADLHAVDFNNGGGDTYWGNSANWSAALPDATGASARMLTSSSNQILTLADSSGNDASFTVGSFTIGTAGGAGGQNYRLNNVSGGTGQLVFDVASGNASLTFTNLYATVTMSVNTGLLLDDNLAINIGRTSGTYSITGKISSGTDLTTGIIVTGPGTVQIGGANDYTGATTINGGILKLITGSDRLTTSTVLSVNGGASSAGTLDLNTFNQTVGGLSGGSGTVTGNVTNQATGTGTAILTVSSTTADSTFAGVITDGTTAKVALTKAGAGTALTLTGANTYTGATTVTGGTLSVTGSLGASVVSVSSGGTLRGTGAISGATTMNSGSILAAGVNASTLGHLTFSSTLTVTGGTFSLKLDSDANAADLISANGVSLSGVTLSLTDLSSTTLILGTSLTILDNTSANSITGTFLGLAEGNTITVGTNIFAISYQGGSGNDITLTAVASAIPEPATYALIAGGVLLVFAPRRKSRAGVRL